MSITSFVPTYQGLILKGWGALIVLMTMSGECQNDYAGV